MTPEQQLGHFIDRYDPKIAKLTRQALAWMRRRFPLASLLVYDNYNALAIGFGRPERPSEAVFSIALYPRWVTLFFLHGATLPDPHKRLKGSGKQVRSIVLDGVETFDDPAVAELIDAAAEREVESLSGGRGEIVIKSVSAKQRPRRRPQR